MAESGAQRPSLAPRNWAGWLMVACVWMLGRLPRAAGRLLVLPLGPVLRFAMVNRRRIAERNIDACFPGWPQAERQRLLRRSFHSLARMLLETAWCWSRPPEQLQDMIEFSGLDRLRQALARGKGVLVVTAHFTCLEIGAMAIGYRVPGRALYRPLRNEVVEWYQNRGRARYADRMINRRRVRGAVQSLHEGFMLWYAPDQDFGAKQSLFVPFFGIRAATLLATHRLPKITGCPVMVMFPRHDPKTGRYRVDVSPCIENYPSDDPAADLARINALLEGQVREAPEQYWWIHRRFKTRPPGEPPFYARGSRAGSRVRTPPG